VLITVAIALLVAAVVLCFVELFVPSMGLVTATGLVCAVGSCIAAFATQNSSIGWVFVALNAVGVLAAFVLSFKYMPRSPVSLKSSSVEEGGYQPVEKLDTLIGAAGVAFTMLRPGGTALINGRKVDVVASGGLIEKDARIKVIAVEGFRVVVEKEVL
jgi:membrane-bound serine protease (ClpP class)